MNEYQAILLDKKFKNIKSKLDNLHMRVNLLILLYEIQNEKINELIEEVHTLKNAPPKKIIKLKHKKRE